MPTPQPTLHHLRRLPIRLRSAALAATLRHASPAERSALAIEIIAIAEDPSGPGVEAIVPLLTHDGGLEPPVWVVLLDSLRPAIAEFLPRLLESGDRARRLGAFRLAAEVLIHRHDESSAVGRLLVDPAIEAAADSAIALAAAEYPDHRLPRILEAIWRSAHRPGPRLARHLNDPDQPSHLPLRAAARPHAMSQPARRLLAWLGVTPLAPIAREALELHVSPERGREERAAFLSDLFAHAHALADPGCAAQIRRLVRAERFIPDPGELAGMPEGARCGMLRFTPLLALKHQMLLATVAGYTSDPSPLARLAAVRLLRSVDATPASDAILIDFARDPDESVAGAAAAALDAAESPSRRRGTLPALASLTDSPHESIRRIAARAARRAIHGAADPGRVVVVAAGREVAPP